MKLSPLNNKNNREVETDQETMDYQDQQDMSELKEEHKGLTACKFHNYKSLIPLDKKLLKEKKLLLHHNGKLLQDQKELLMDKLLLDLIQTNSISEETNVTIQMPSGKLT